MDGKKVCNAYLLTYFFYTFPTIKANLFGAISRNIDGWKKSM